MYKYFEISEDNLKFINEFKAEQGIKSDKEAFNKIIELYRDSTAEDKNKKMIDEIMQRFHESYGIIYTKLLAGSVKMESKFFANGATPGGILEDPGTVKDPQRGRDSWTSAFGGSSNFNKVAVLEEGMKYTPISISPEQAQFLETRKFQINEIARSKQKSGWLHGRS